MKNKTNAAKSTDKELSTSHEVIAAYSSRQPEVFRHDGDSLCMDSAQVGVFKHPHQECLRCLKHKNVTTVLINWWKIHGGLLIINENKIRHNADHCYKQLHTTNKMFYSDVNWLRRVTTIRGLIIPFTPSLAV